jgi:hypothetical protein
MYAKLFRPTICGCAVVLGRDVFQILFAHGFNMFEFLVVIVVEFNIRMFLLRSVVWLLNIHFLICKLSYFVRLFVVAP